VAETDEIRKKSRSEAAKRGWATKRARVWPWSVMNISSWLYTWYIHCIYITYPVFQ
jgi:hypothetical protein